MKVFSVQSASTNLPFSYFIIFSSGLHTHTLISPLWQPVKVMHLVEQSWVTSHIRHFKYSFPCVSLSSSSSSVVAQHCVHCLGSLWQLDEPLVDIIYLCVHSACRLSVCCGTACLCPDCCTGQGQGFVMHTHTHIYIQYVHRVLHRWRIKDVTVFSKNDMAWWHKVLKVQSDEESGQ